ncbi:unnamed protein product [Lampetra planeri]
MRSTGGPMKRRQEQEMERESGCARPQGPRSEQPGPVQVLLTPNLEEEEDQAMPNQDAALGLDPPPPNYWPAHPRPPLSLSITHPCAPCSRGKEEVGGCTGRRGGEEEDGREGTGVRLCELLQAGGVSVRPLGKHLAISLPSLPLRFWDTHATHSTQSPPTQPPNPPTPPSSPPEASGQRKPITPLWQSPQPPASTDQPWQRHEAPFDSGTRHWSSWSLDRPDAVVTPYDTPPDRCSALEIRPQPPRLNYSYKCQAPLGHYGSQHTPGPTADPRGDHEEAELSELDSLYQASLLAGKTGCSPSEKLISRVGGQARSKTPNADMERSVYGADGTRNPTYLNKPMMLQNLRLGVELDEGENLRRIGRSLSGTVVTSRRSRLTATRSFELSGGAGSFWLCLTGVKLSADHSPALRH